jgi:hypothetical protein
LRVNKKGWEQLNEDAVGYVYAFNKNDFTKRELGGIEYVSYAMVRPVQILQVKKSDLPDYIEVFES